ncbi:hypothetical protein GCM10020000_07280 [Streptomyces olivoverticillatus]|uniref:HNH endonuclease signature motif containing protein n=1 Tax=Streptomyces olivoverticillatus TaxID=66427 RepID=UPI0016103C6A
MPDIIPSITGSNEAPYGDPRLPERFWLKVEVADTGCWLWTAKVRYGYGQFSHRVNGKDQSVRAHRHSYTVLVGPIPVGLHIDHLCRTRHCVNPAHLEPVTQGENNRRAGQARTHCMHGHPITKASTYTDPRGRRQCQPCRAARNRKYRARRAATISAGGDSR